jgi:hypothetical protein
MNVIEDPFVFHAILLIFTPVFLLVFALLWKNAREVGRLTTGSAQQMRFCLPIRQPCSQPMYIERFLATPPHGAEALCHSTGSLFTADEGSTYSCFGDSLVSRSWLLSPEDSVALDKAFSSH